MTSFKSVRYAYVQQFGQSPTIVRRAGCVPSAPLWLWTLATLIANVKLVYLIPRLQRRGEEGRTKRGWADRNTSRCPIDRRTGTGTHQRQEGMSTVEEKGGTDIERKLNRHDKLIIPRSANWTSRRPCSAAPMSRTQNSLKPFGACCSHARASTHTDTDVLYVTH